MSNLKIGLVLDDSLDKTDGVQQYVLTLGKWLSERGHNVHYLVGESRRADLANVHSLSRNLNVRFNGNRMSTPLPASTAAITCLLDHEQFDVLHVQLPYSPWLAGRIIKNAASHMAVVGTFHVAPDSSLVAAGNKVLGMALKSSLRRFDSVTSVSSVAQAFCRKAYGVDSTVLPNMVRLNPFFNATPLPRYKNTCNIVFLNRLVERKGCQYLLKAIACLEATQLAETPYKVIICGDGPLRPKLERYVREQKLSHIVSFMGRVSEEDKPRCLAAADIAIYPSTGGESFGIVLIEGMAAARGAVLAGNNPGYASVMEARPESLFDPTDSPAMAQKLADLLRNKTERGLAHVWQQAHVAQYDVDVVCPEVEALYQSALHKRRQ